MGPPLVVVPNGKEQRMKDEEKMKVGVAWGGVLWTPFRQDVIGGGGGGGGK